MIIEIVDGLFPVDQLNLLALNYLFSWKEEIPHTT